ncbi:MAG: hypothetical protein NZ853_06750 [Leptospiraceae bacterium]|nr:hypothetical protein [Leptospiraceae bacterium]MDW7975868.1 hypothetical protein [Leptospiraceae bacterium]
MKSQDFVSSTELSAAIIGLNPSVEREIKFIEQATYAALNITGNPLSLRLLNQATNFDSNVLRILTQRKVLISYEFFDYENSKLQKKIGLIRPPTLKQDDVEKIKKICNEYSLISLIKFLIDDEVKGYETFFEIYRNLLKLLNQIEIPTRSQLLDLIQNFYELSFNAFIKKLNLHIELYQYFIQFLTMTSIDIHNYFATSKFLTEDIKIYLFQRGNHPLLVSIDEEFHLFYPTISSLTYVADQHYFFKKSNIESTFEVGMEILKKIISYFDFIKPTEIKTYDTIFDFFIQHSSLQNEDSWPGLKRMVSILSKLTGIVESILNQKKSYFMDLFTNEFLKKFNMNFEPYYVSENMMEVPVELENLLDELKITKKELFENLILNLNKNPELIIYQSKQSNPERGYYVIYKYNIPRAFIRNKDKRSFIHIMLKGSNYSNGIYDFVIPESSIPAPLKEDQQLLRKAIKEWEKEIQKKNKKSLVSLIIDFFFLLWEFFQKLGSSSVKQATVENINKNKQENFNVKTFNNKPNENKIVEETNEQKKEKKLKLKRPYIPKEKLKTIPDRIERAIEYIERQYQDLIWIDELAFALNYKDDIEKLSSLLYYDKLQRFEEIKSLKDIKPLYIRRENLMNEKWIEKTINYLKQSSKLPHQVALLEYLEKFREIVEQD